MTTDHEFADDVAAYALGTLDDQDRATFEAHLEACPRCQAELAEHRRVVAAIGAGIEPVSVPEALKGKTLVRASGRPAAVAEPQKGRLRWTWLQAAAVLLIGVLGGYVASLRTTVHVLSQELSRATQQAETLRQELATLRQQHTQLASMVDIFGAPDVVRVDLRGTSPSVSATARAYVSLNEGLIFRAANLPPLGAERVYQLWIIPAGAPAPISAGLLPVDASGGAQLRIDLPPGVTSVGTLAVTNEPGPTGSLGPTTTPFLAGTAGG